MVVKTKKKYKTKAWKKKKKKTKKKLKTFKRSNRILFKRNVKNFLLKQKKELLLLLV